MAPISSGINRLRAFEIPCGIWADGEYVASPRTVLVRWDSNWSDKIYQVYVNGQYAGVTIDSQQRQMIVQVPTSLEVPVRIEIFAVEAADAYKDFSGEVNLSVGHSGRAKISILRQQDMPVGSSVQVYSDNGTGQIDYNSPFNSLPIRVWPGWQDKAGFGMSRHGFGDFGYDSAGSAGFGKGGFGRDWFGIDADTIEWISKQMTTGVYKFSVKVVDKAGNQSSAGEVKEVTVIPAPRPAEQLDISSYDKQTGQLSLSIS